jgi:hypothetical protein
MLRHACEGTFDMLGAWCPAEEEESLLFKHISTFLLTSSPAHIRCQTCQTFPLGRCGAGLAAVAPVHLGREAARSSPADVLAALAGSTRPGSRGLAHPLHPGTPASWDSWECWELRGRVEAAEEVITHFFSNAPNVRLSLCPLPPDCAALHLRSCPPVP